MRLSENFVAVKWIAGNYLLGLLVSITLSMVIGTLICKQYIVFDSSYTRLTEASVMQMHAVDLIHLLNKEIRNAGYVGCTNVVTGLPVISYQSYTINRANRLQIEKGRLLSRHASRQVASVLSHDAAQNKIYITDNFPLHVGTMLILSNCFKAEIIEVGRLHHIRQHWVIEAKNVIHEHFDRGAEAAYYEEDEIYVGQVHRKQDLKPFVTMLYLKALNKKAKPLFAYIENLHFEYIADHEKLIGVKYSFQTNPGGQRREWRGYALLP